VKHISYRTLGPQTFAFPKCMLLNTDHDNTSDMVGRNTYFGPDNSANSYVYSKTAFNRLLAATVELPSPL
jgi:hypothetical protein